MRERNVHESTTHYQAGEASLTVTERTVHEVRGAAAIIEREGDQFDDALDRLDDVLGEMDIEVELEDEPEGLVPEVGDWVLYTLTDHDVRKIFDRRTSACGVNHSNGNRHEAGQVLPGVIVRTWGDSPGSAANLRVFLDGDDTLWVTSVSEGEGPGHFTFLTD